MATVYKINKSINKPVEFRGLKAQYIVYLAAALLMLLVLFAVLYLIGVNTYICLFLILGAGTAAFLFTYRLSDRYGEHGMMKKIARKKIPGTIKTNDRKIFQMHQQNGK